GLGTQNDVTRAELERATAALERTRAAGALASTRLALSYLIGGEAPRILAEPAVALPEESDVAALTASAASRRPDLAALDARVRAAEARSLEPRLGLLPSIDL